ncbi:MAG: hypothetical protein KF894_05480 [Labilithrix sp.]|nr:hypothetical protein [Labilithrix sp.]
MVVNSLACGQCGAGLAQPDASVGTSCVDCGAEHQGDRSSGVRATTRVERASWRDCEDAARIRLTDEGVHDFVRQHFADVGSVLVCPYIPPADEQAARLAHVDHLAAHERVLALYETGSFGGHEGFVLTARRVCWRNPGEPARAIEWRDLEPERLYVDAQRLVLGDEVIVLPDPDVLDACADAFHVLALSGLPRPPVVARPEPEPPARTPSAPQEPAAVELSSDHLELTTDDDDVQCVAARRDTTPPPPHTTSYFAYASHAQSQAPDCSCWRCYTPLYETTPECAFCGATPTRAGWLRTG